MKKKFLPAQDSANIATLKAELSKYIRFVKSGKRITVTEHNHPVATLIPIEEHQSETAPITTTAAEMTFSHALDLAGKLDPIKTEKTPILDILLDDRSRR